MSSRIVSQIIEITFNHTISNFFQGLPPMSKFVSFNLYKPLAKL